MYCIIYFILPLISGLNGFNILDSENGCNHLIEEMKRHVQTLNYRNSDVEEKWIDQPLDHFDSTEKRKWKMRYFENLQFWKSNGPIYLFIGGEVEASKASLQTGLLVELASETKGAMFASEHRYYGHSIPNIDTNVTANLKYLSSRQALADLSYLLQTIKSSPQFAKSTKSKIVVVGGSYAGNLAAWMRLLYPNLVHAAISSSAPVLAKKDFYEYLEKLSDDYKTFGSSSCYEEITKIFERYVYLLKSAGGILKLKAENNICLDIDMTVSENKQFFFISAIDGYVWAAQNDFPKDIQISCEIMMKRLPSVPSIKSNIYAQRLWRKNDICIDLSFQMLVKTVKQNRMWFYQKCTEFGYFKTTNSTKQIFTNNVHPDLYYKLCTTIFGPEFDENRVDKGIESTNKFYGGNTPNVSRVVFVNGNMDPWSNLEVLQAPSPETPTIIINGSSHCRDLMPHSDQDTQEIIEARKQEKDFIKRWIRSG